MFVIRPLHMTSLTCPTRRPHEFSIRIECWLDVPHVHGTGDTSAWCLFRDRFSVCRPRPLTPNRPKVPFTGIVGSKNHEPKRA